MLEIFGLRDKIMPKDSITRFEKGRRYSSSWADAPRTGKVTDAMIANYVKKHTHWWDRLDTHFVSDCVMQAYDILFGYVRPPKKGKWYFGVYSFGHWIEDEEWDKMDKEKYIKEYLRD